jgi:hypothetical protein
MIILSYIIGSIIGGFIAMPLMFLYMWFEDWFDTRTSTPLKEVPKKWKYIILLSLENLKQNSGSADPIAYVKGLCKGRKKHFSVDYDNKFQVAFRTVRHDVILAVRKESDVARIKLLLPDAVISSNTREEVNLMTKNRLDGRFTVTDIYVPYLEAGFPYTINLSGVYQKLLSEWYWI